MRYLMKGGYWKNSEDEILKAAVMKYGLNQWSRISSLIARKSAKQCKARWYEWLDPSIKKTEWTREEEEKLLYLAKIFPSQWRTIAPVVGRTPAQCVEHYERLLDRAQGRDEIDENDPRKLKPGEIDPTPEIRPARADAKDMDDDEKEMIAEARVRLANIKGKKAKRRAREKFIERTRQSAQHQKQRELRAAGIEYVIEKKKKKKKVEIDYNAEIPFEHRPTEEVYKTGNDEEPAPNPNIGNISLNTIEGTRRDEEEKHLRKLDQKKLKKLRAMNLPEHIDKLNKVNPLMYQKKTRLVLTDPQLTDKDLDLLGKMTKRMADTMTSSTSDTTRELVGNYSVREPTPVKTPKYSSQLMKDARHAYNLMTAPSPMHGGEHLVAPPDGIDGDKSRRSGVTPNPYKKLIVESIPVSRGETPLSVTAKSRLAERDNVKPLYHDELQINNDDWEDMNWEEKSQYGSTNGADLNRFDRIREIIRRNLETLPRARNDYEFDLPELERFNQLEKELFSSKNRKMDLEDIEEIRAEAKDQEKLRDFYRQSQVKQRGLPIPTHLAADLISDLESRASSSSVKDPRLLIRKEMGQMIVNDIFENKVVRADSQLLQYYNKATAEEFEIEELEKAEYLLNEEHSKMVFEMNIDQEELETKFCELLGKRSIYPSDKEQQTELPELKKVERILTSQIKKLESEINEQFDERQMQVLSAQIKLLHQDIETKLIELEVYEQLKEQESLAMIQRLHDDDIFIQALREKERVLQQLYRDYQSELNTTNS